MFHTKIPSGKHKDWYRYFSHGEKIKVISYAAGKGDHPNDLRPINYFDGSGKINELAKAL